MYKYLYLSLIVASIGLIPIQAQNTLNPQYTPSGTQAMWAATDSFGWTTDIGNLAGQNCTLSLWTGRVTQPSATHPNADTGGFTAKIRLSEYPWTTLDVHPEITGINPIFSESIESQPLGSWRQRSYDFTVPGQIEDSLMLDIATLTTGAKYYDLVNLICDGNEVVNEDFENPDILTSPYVVGNPPRIPGSALDWKCVHCALVLPGDTIFYDINSPTEPEQPASLTAHLSLDSVISNVVQDESGKGNSGYVFGTPQLIPGVSGNALSFNGLTDYIDISSPDVKIDDSNYSFFAWFRTTNPDYETIAADRDSKSIAPGWFLRIGDSIGDGDIHLRLEETNGQKKLYKTSGLSGIKDGNWHHVGFTWNNPDDTLKIYLDGSEVENIVKSIDHPLSGDSILSDSNNLQIGRRPDDTQHFKGDLDEIRIYNGVLSEDEIRDLFNLSIPDPESVSPITVLFPNGGESWTVGETRDISWTASSSIASVRIEYSKDDFASSNLIASSTSGNSYQWLVPDDVSSSVKIRIADLINPLIFDMNDNYFNITQPSEPDNPTACQDLSNDSNLQGWWNLDEDNLTRLDLSGNNNHLGETGLTRSNQIDFKEGVASADFIGSNSQKLLSNDSSLANGICGKNGEVTSACSWGAWVKTNDLGRTQDVFGKNLLWRIVITADNKLRCAMQDQSGVQHLVNSDSSVSTDTWYHISCVWDGSDLKMRLNGLDQTTVKHPTSMKSGLDVLSAYYRAAGGLNGHLDEAFVFNRNLTDQESDCVMSETLNADNI
jgi:hypothetical protein